MVAPVFATLIFEFVVGLLESIWRLCKEGSLRHDESRAPMILSTTAGLRSRFMYQVRRQADMPFTSSNFSDRETRV